MWHSATEGNFAKRKFATPALQRPAERPPVAKNHAPDIGKLLVTGGTGFIGGAVLAELMQTEKWPRVFVMVRAKDRDEARSRIVASITRFFPGEDVSGRVSDEQIIAAGLEDCAGLVHDRRMREVTHVIHSAAVTSFANDPRIKAVNVDASLDFVSVLRDCANVKRFINVGTAWCVGMDVEKIVIEDGEQGSSEHVVPYTESKLEFERAVRLKYPDFPLISARPSIVVGHTKLGTRPSGSIYWVFRSVQILGQFTPAFDGRMDVVPVDWVAQSLLQLTQKPDLWFDTYHLSAGTTSYSTVGQLDTAIAAGRMVEPHGRAGYKRVNTRELAKAVYDRRSDLGGAHPLILARALSIYAKFAESGVVFDNARTLAEGVAPPPPFHSYADECARTSENSSIAAQMEDDFK